MDLAFRTFIPSSDGRIARDILPSIVLNNNNYLF
jgi:hypothetical protein